MADERTSKWGCSRCGREDRSGSPLSEAQRQKLRNCGDTRTNRQIGPCPWREVTTTSYELITFWSRWKTLGGDIGEKLGPIVDAIETCETEMRRLEQAQIDAAKSKT